MKRIPGASPSPEEQGHSVDIGGRICEPRCDPATKAASSPEGHRSMLQVAITGTLSLPRKEAAALIDSTSNAYFHAKVTFQTNCLVAAILDSGKVRKAAKIGVAIITEAEMMQHVAAGMFPENVAPMRSVHVSNFPDIEWTLQHESGRPCFIEYEDVSGIVTQRYVIVQCESRATNGHDYVGAMDGEGFKTFRRDRFRRLKYL
jgi:SOS-response transcriptional repressor LexA